MKRNKILKKGILLTLIMVLCLAVYMISAQTLEEGVKDNVPEATSPASPEVGRDKLENTGVPGLVLSGAVQFSDLEGGFYELDGYRLTGDFDFSQYEGKFAVAIGDLDESPSIYMVRTLKVTDMVASEDLQFKAKMDQWIEAYKAALDKAADKAEAEVISNNLAALELILFKNVEEGSQSGDILTGTGKYVGQIDSNFIEIEVDGVTTRSFQLSDPIKESFDDYKLKTGDSVAFRYREVEGQNPVIEKIEKQ